MNNIDWKKINKIFFIGIKGVGMMPLSLIAKEAGFIIAGSDIPEEFITDEVLDENNIEVFSGFETKDIENFFNTIESEASLVVVTGAHSGYDNPQAAWAKSNGISVLNQGQALGIFMTGKPFGRNLKGITVTGSHGKTTVSAMLSSAFAGLGLDPSYSVGTSYIFPLGYSGHFGKGEFFIAEGDEYVGEPVYDRTPKIYYHKPEIAIINNIDFDHPDVYKDIEDVRNTILKFINGMDKNGKVFMSSDDPHLNEIRDEIRSDLNVFLYGRENSDYTLSELESREGLISFNVYYKNSLLGNFELSIPGEHNAYNALAVISVLDNLGYSVSEIGRVIKGYKGCKRRMEKIGQTAEGIIVLDDYGHHPAEINSTLKALKEFYGKRIVCIFQSHTFSRTKKFLKQFSESFSVVDKLILLPIFKSQRDTESDIISNEDFARAFKEKVTEVYLASSIDDASNHVKNLEISNDFVIVTIGAGDVYKVGYKLVK